RRPIARVRRLRRRAQVRLGQRGDRQRQGRREQSASGQTGRGPLRLGGLSRSQFVQPPGLAGFALPHGRFSNDHCSEEMTCSLWLPLRRVVSAPILPVALVPLLSWGCAPQGPSRAASTASAPQPGLVKSEFIFEPAPFTRSHAPPIYEPPA